MKVLRDPQIISGFIYNEPVDEIPALTHCGEALCCRGHTLSSHAHEGFEFLYLSRGTCLWEMNRTTFRQSMGDLFIPHPGQHHRTGPGRNPENRHIWIGLSLEGLGPRGARLARDLRRGGVHLLSGCHEVEPLLQAIVNQVMTLRPRRAEVIAALLHAVIPLIGQRLEHALSGAQSDPDFGVVPYSFAVQRAIAYMRQNLDRRIPLPDLAAAATFRSGPHFCSLFHRETGMTPGRFHLQLRLDGARDALRLPSGSVTDVALRFGFSSSQHFSTLFRRTLGVTPRQWQTSVASGT